MVGYELRLGKVGRSLQTHGKRVQAGPVGACLRIILNTVLTELLGKCRDDTGVETAAEQHTVWHITHQLTLHGSSQTVTNGFNAGRIILHSIIVHPVTTVIPLLPWVNTPIIVSWQERLVAFALAFKGFQL